MMKPISLLAFCLMALTAVSTYAADDVYLPPSATAADEDDAGSSENLAAAPIDESETAAANGYQYRTVRRFRTRTSRDVSHLNHEYLPPVVAKPATHYLPPIERTPARPVQLNNEYLPPPVETPTESVTETEPPTTTAAATTTTPPTTTTTTTPATTTTTTTEAATEAPATEAIEILPPEKIVDDTAILTDDGYHYKKPDVIPDLGPVREYLPPLDENVIVDEIPGNEEESTVLAGNGYQYRAIRRLRF